MDEKHSKFVEGLDDAEQENLVKEGFWKKLQSNFKYIPFARDGVASYYCMLDEKVPYAVRAAIALPLAYFVMPLDLAPDFIVGLGYTDDAAVFTAALSAFRSYLNSDHYSNADSALGTLPETSND